MSRKVYSNAAKGWIAPPKDDCVSCCKANRCLCCKVLNIENTFTSFSTGKSFVLESTSGNVFTCKSRYVVYLISCIKCGAQYVGKTAQPLHCRLNGHRHSIIKKSLNTFLCLHFNLLDHSYEDLSIQIIGGVDWQNLSTAEAGAELDKMEDFYIRILNTLFPLGLNDKLSGGGCISRYSIDKVPYFCSPVVRRTRSHGIKKSGRRKARFHGNMLELASELNFLFMTRNYKSLYQRLNQLPKMELKLLYPHITMYGKEFESVFNSFYTSRFLKNIVTDDKTDRSVVVVDFNCKNFDQLYLPSVLGRKDICNLVPDAVKHIYPPKIYYKLDSPTGRRLCNYNRFLGSIDLDDIKRILTEECCCKDYPTYVYREYDHVLTGDLNIVEDVELRSLMKKGTKFRIARFLPWKKVVDTLHKALCEHVKKISKRYRIAVQSFDAWLTGIMSLIDQRISRLKKNYNRFNAKWSFKTLKNSIDSLHDKFVITQVDKASNNFAVVCKKFYLLVLLKELGFNLVDFNPIGNVTYSPVDRQSKEIIDNHNNKLSSLFGMTVNEVNSKLPKLFWIPKLHTSPYKFRFIAGARNCSTKELSVIVNKGLSVVRSQFKFYCDSIRRSSGFDCFWSVKSSEEFLIKIRSKDVHTVQVFDFSTLYTNLNQDEILSHLFSLFQIVFSETSRKYLCVGWERSFFSAKTYRGFKCFSLHDFKDAIKFIIQEVFVQFGGLVFKQTKGVPMGGNSSPLLADLFLTHCEFVFMKNLISDKKFGLAALLSRTSRYIDDLGIVNYKHFDSLLSRIYPLDLVAERSGGNDKEVEYLDIQLCVKRDGVHTSVYHKVDAFNFHVILLTFPESQIPFEMGLRIFASQVLRYLRICSHLQYVIDKVKKTLRLLVDRGYKRIQLRRAAEKLLNRHTHVLTKFRLTSGRQLSVACELC